MPRLQRPFVCLGSCCLPPIGCICAPALNNHASRLFTAECHKDDAGCSSRRFQCRRIVPATVTYVCPPAAVRPRRLHICNGHSRASVVPAIARRLPPSPASVPQPSIIVPVAYSLPSATRMTRVVPPGAFNAAASSLPPSPTSADLLLSAPAYSTSAMAIPVHRWFLLLPAISRPSPASVPQPSIIVPVACSLPSATRTTRVVPPGASNATASSLVMCRARLRAVSPSCRAPEARAY